MLQIPLPMTADLVSSSLGMPGRALLRPLRRQSRQSRALWRAMRRWPFSLARIGGAYRDRTDDLMLAKQPLSQLS